MKYSIIFIFALSLTVFSCGGTPKSDTAKPFLPHSEEIQNESYLSSVLENYVEPLLLEESPAVELSMEDSYEIDTFEEIAEFDITGESAATGYPEQDEIAVTEIEEPEPLLDVIEITSIDEPQFTPQIAQVPEVPLESPVQIQAEIPPYVSAPSGISSVQTQPSSQVQVQPPAQAQTQPTAQITRQPQSVQTPLPLAPAEERPAVEIENVPARTEPLRLDVAKDEPVTPFQTVLVPQNEAITFSRIVRATVGQIIEIPFRGTGWVYMGELASRRGIVYDSRRLDPEGQSFIFTIEDAGTYALKFFREDFIRDYILNDYVQVIAGEAPVSGGAGWFNPPVDRGRVTAQPRWPTALEEAEILRGGTGSRPAVETPSANTSERGIVSSQGTVPAQDSVPAQGTSLTQGAVPMQQTAQPQVATAVPSQPGVIEAPLSPDIILQRAKDTFDSGNVSAAISLLDQYSEYYHSGTDELYWLYGQFYEANSPSRNILLSLDYYRRLVREYPQSGRYNSARSRIAYLERYYINIQ